MSREELNIGALPGRKRKALSITTFHDGGGASIEPIAYFQSGRRMSTSGGFSRDAGWFSSLRSPNPESHGGHA